MTTHHNVTGHSTQQTTTMPDTPDSKNSPTGNQQDLPQVPVGIDHADARPVSSEGNQAIPGNEDIKIGLNIYTKA